MRTQCFLTIIYAMLNIEKHSPKHIRYERRQHLRFYHLLLFAITATLVLYCGNVCGFATTWTRSCFSIDGRIRNRFLAQGGAFTRYHYTNRARRGHADHIHVIMKMYVSNTGTPAVSIEPQSSHQQQGHQQQPMRKKEEPKREENVLSTRNFPFQLIVNLNEIKHALLLAAINPRMGGVIISGGRGTGKSVLARAVHDLLPSHIERIKGSPYNIDPEGKLGTDSFIESELQKSLGDVANLETEWIPTPFVQIPLNVMEDSLIGTVDFEQSLKEGKTVFSPGLLAKAHRSVLYVDELNLLDDEAANILLNVINEGYVSVEREGTSIRYPCQPLMFIATYNPAEGEIRDHLMDRIGVSLSVDAYPLTISERVRGVMNVLAYSGDMNVQESEQIDRTLRKAEEEQQQLRDIIVQARELLPSVNITGDQILYLCEEATRADCEGQRAEIFACEVAKACAALHGRVQVNADDLRMAVVLAIAPRGIYMLQPPDDEEEGEGDHDDDDSPSRKRRPRQPQPMMMPPEIEDSHEEEEDEEERDEEQEDESKPDDDDTEEEEEEIIEEQLPPQFMFDVDATPIDPKLLQFTKWSRKGKGGKRSKIFSLERGRYVKPIFPKGNKQGKLAVGATLRASAPYQKFRRDQHQRLRSLMTANHRNRADRKVFIKKDDFRIKKMARKAGSLIIFLVDASGSMALNRMNAAKGAAVSLLAEAYKSRDKICLIAFHDTMAEVLVPPTKSMALTKNRLESMPCGGGSPLSHALMTAMRTGLNAVKVKKDCGRIVIVLITDGRANIPLSVSMGEGFDFDADPDYKEGTGIPSRNYLRNEALACAKKLGALADFNLLCVDTEDQFVGTGIAKDIATAARGNYFHILEGNGDFTSMVSEVAKKGLEAARRHSNASSYYSAPKASSYYSGPKPVR